MPKGTGYGSMHVRVAGQRGGLRLFRKRGKKWMRKIGRLGGLKSRRRHKR